MTVIVFEMMERIKHQRSMAKIAKSNQHATTKKPNDQLRITVLNLQIVSKPTQNLIHFTFYESNDVLYFVCVSVILDTIVTFLPKNLWEQFQRIANFYFLVMTAVAIIIGK